GGDRGARADPADRVGTSARRRGGGRAVGVSRLPRHHDPATRPQRIYEPETAKLRALCRETTSSLSRIYEFALHYRYGEPRPPPRRNGTARYARTLPCGHRRR